MERSTGEGCSERTRKKREKAGQQEMRGKRGRVRSRGGKKGEEANT